MDALVLIRKASDLLDRYEEHNKKMAALLSDIEAAIKAKREKDAAAA